MTKIRALCLVVFLCLGSAAEAYIPPILMMLREVTDGRKAGPIEVILRHRVSVKGQGQIDIEERILQERNKLQFIWSGRNLGGTFSGVWERYNYIVSDRTLPARSAAFVAYLTSFAAEPIRDVLLAEQFVRRDQMLQFRPGFQPVGDPQSWNLRENYLRHGDIYLQRMPAGIAITVVGMEEGSVRKAVYFDRGLKGIRRLEWREGQEIHTWNFEGFTNWAAGGTFPKRLFLESNGSEVISSDLVNVRAANAKQLSDFKTAWRNAERAQVSEKTEEALRLLLSFR